MNKIVKLIDKINTLVGYFTGFVTFFLLLLVLWGVFARYILRSPSHVALEISGYLMVLLTFLGAGYIHLQKKHVSVEVLTSRLPEKFKKIHEITVNIVLLLFSLIVIYEGIEFTILAFKENYRSTSLLNFPLWTVFIIIPIGMFFFLLQIIRNLIRGKE